MSTTATLESSGIEHASADENLDYLNQYVSFWLGEQLLGVPVNSVQEVLNPQTRFSTVESYSCT